jgi:hypothetical protein
MEVIPVGTTKLPAPVAVIYVLCVQVEVPVIEAVASMDTGGLNLYDCTAVIEAVVTADTGG